MINEPNTTVNILNAEREAEISARNILFIGQKLSTGSATSGEVQDNLISEADFIAKFGAGSQLAKIAKLVFETLKSSARRPKLSAIGLNDATTTTSATATITAAGTATESGDIKIYVDSYKLVHNVSIVNGDSANTIAGKVNTAINANSNSVVTSAVNNAVSTLTAKNGGTQGNSIGIVIEGSVAGVTLTTSGILSGGAGDPSITNLFDPIANRRFSSIVFPKELGLQNVATFLDARFNSNNQILDGVAISSITDTFANTFSTINGFNSKSLAIIPNNLVDTNDYRGGSIFESPFTISAIAATIRELRLTANSNIANIMSNGLSRGGSNLAGIPYFNTLVSVLSTERTSHQFTKAQLMQLEEAGSWIIGNNVANSAIIFGEARTTYKTNISGQEDTTFKFLNTIDSLSIAREYIFNNLKVDYVQHQLLPAGSRLTAGFPQVTPELFIANMMGYWSTLSGFNGDRDYLVFSSNIESMNKFRETLQNTIVANLSTGTITASTIAGIVSQVREIFIDLIPTFNSN